MGAEVATTPSRSAKARSSRSPVRLTMASPSADRVDQRQHLGLRGDDHVAQEPGKVVFPELPVSSIVVTLPAAHNGSGSSPSVVWPR